MFPDCAFVWFALQWTRNKRGSFNSWIPFLLHRITGKRDAISITHSILPAPLLTQVWLQWCVTLVQRGCSGPPRVPWGALSQMRWQVWRQSSSTLHSQAQKPTTNTIKTPSPTSRLGSLLWFAWLLSSARDMKSTVSGDRVTGQASLYHGKCIFTSARQMLAFMHPSL